MNVAKLGYAPAWTPGCGLVFCRVTPRGMSGGCRCVLGSVGAQMLGKMLGIPGHTVCCII